MTHAVSPDTRSAIHLIGGEKGGGGKSLVSRPLTQHFIYRVIRLKHLQDAVLRKIDALDVSFWAARHAPGNEGPKLVLLGRQWLKPCPAAAASRCAP